MLGETGKTSRGKVGAGGVCPVLAWDYGDRRQAMETKGRQCNGEFTRQDYDVSYTSIVRPRSVEIVWVGMALGTYQGKPISTGDGR